MKINIGFATPAELHAAPDLRAAPEQLQLAAIRRRRAGPLGQPPHLQLAAVRRRGAGPAVRIEVNNSE